MNKVCLDDIYDKLDQKTKDYVDWLSRNRNTIRGRYEDTYYKNGGWNGMMDALREAEKADGIEPPAFEEGVDGMDGSELQEIIMNETIM